MRRRRDSGSTVSKHSTESCRRAFAPSTTCQQPPSSCAAQAIQKAFCFPGLSSDFSLIDAIESGIVKLPRVPVTDNLVQTDTVVYRDLWKEIGKDLPKTAAGANKLSPVRPSQHAEDSVERPVQPL